MAGHFFRRITHTSLALLAISLLSLILLQSHLPNILFGLVALVGGFILFVARLWGGGDAKLVTVLALSFQSNAFYDFLFLTAFIGGLVAIGGLIFFVIIYVVTACLTVSLSLWHLSLFTPWRLFIINPA